MPIDPASIAALSVAATSLGQTGANAYAQGKMNRKTRKWNEHMYRVQRQDSLNDYHMQNDYNSPQKQMERLRMAGLNPNLVYKNGATHDAAPIRSTEVKGWNPDPIQFDMSGVGTGLSAYMDMRMKEVQIDNLKTANTVAVQEAALKAAQTASTVQGTKSSEFALKQAEALSSTSLETAKAQLEKLKTDTYVTLEANERAAAQSSKSLEEATERILSIRASRAKTEDERREIEEKIKSIRADTTLKDLDIELKRNGIQPTDPLYMRILGRILSSDKKLSPKEILPYLKKELTN